MKKILWVIGWWFFIAGWFAIVIWPIRLIIAAWQMGRAPSAVEMVPTVTLVVIGIGFVLLGKYLRARS